MCFSSHDHSGHVKNLVDSLPTIRMLALKLWLTSYVSHYLLTECSHVVLTAVVVVQMGMTVWPQILMGKSENHAEAAPLQSDNGASDGETSEEDSDK